MSEEKKSFPNIPVTHWINLRAQFKKSIPGTITSNYLASVLGMTESSAKANISPSLRVIGLIDGEGKTNQDLAKKLRDDELYPKFCEDTIKRLYPQELRDAFPDKDANKQKIKTWFMNHSGVGDNGAYKLQAFYSALVDADISGPKTSKVNGASKAKETKVKAIKTVSKPVEKTTTTTTKTEHEEKSPDHQIEQKHNSGPSLNMNIQIHISSDASSDQIKSIFENMAKYIYKN